MMVNKLVNVIEQQVAFATAVREGYISRDPTKQSQSPGHNSIKYWPVFFQFFSPIYSAVNVQL